jgi:hypothetical protein
VSKNNVIDIRTKARPVRVRDQEEIIEQRRKKRREKIDKVKNQVKKELRNNY